MANITLDVTTNVSVISTLAVVEYEPFRIEEIVVVYSSIALNRDTTIDLTTEIPVESEFNRVYEMSLSDALTVTQDFNTKGLVFESSLDVTSTYDIEQIRSIVTTVEPEVSVVFNQEKQMQLTTTVAPQTSFAYWVE